MSYRTAIEVVAICVRACAERNRFWLYRFHLSSANLRIEHQRNMHIYIYISLIVQ